MKAKLFCLGILLHSLLLFSQSDSTKQYTLGFNHARGFIIKHSPTLSSLANRHISMSELYIEQNTYGKQVWHQRYNYLKIGFSLKHFNLNNKQNLGNAISIAPFLKINIINKNNFSLRFKPSIGLGYIAKRFHADNNYKNVAIGSHLNLYISAFVMANIKVLKSIYWNAGIGLDHLSNTGFKTPNLGINMPFVSSGLSIDLGNSIEKQKTTEGSYVREKAYWQLSTGVGLNEINPPNEKKYLASALSITREKKMNRKSSLGFGIDLFYNPAQKAALERDTISINNFENIQVAFSALHLLHFGKLTFTSQLSYYLKTENQELGNIYHVFGGRYPIGEQTNVFFSGKTHIDKAEYILVGFGYRFKHE